MASQQQLTAVDTEQLQAAIALLRASSGLPYQQLEPIIRALEEGKPVVDGQVR